jgi:hypothetical protein
MKFSKFQREKRSFDPRPRKEQEGGSNKDILLLDRKTDMEANFISRAISGEQEIYWDVNGINNWSEGILKGIL